MRTNNSMREAARFPAKDDQGNTYTIIKYSRIVNASDSDSGSVREAMEVSTYVTDDNQEVIPYIGAGYDFEIPDLDVKIVMV